MTRGKAGGGMGSGVGDCYRNPGIMTTGTEESKGEGSGLEGETEFRFPSSVVRIHGDTALL